MKRGLIAWDKTELPEAAFEARLASVRKRLAAQKLPALVVYSDLWRSNYGRFYSNFMPYFNRGLLVIPVEDKPVLLCGLSQRVYPWIKSVTILEEILPSPDLARKLLEICSQRGWKRIGVPDPAGLPYDLYSALGRGVAIESVAHEGDVWERSMHRHAAEIARTGLAEELAAGAGIKDYEFVGRLERKLRRAGAEDLVILLTNGDTAPAPAKGQSLRAGFSVSLALEYRGHWVKLALPHGGVGDPAPKGEVWWELLSGPLPYQPIQTPARGSVVAQFVELRGKGGRLFQGDTFWYGTNGFESL